LEDERASARVGNGKRLATRLKRRECGLPFEGLRLEPDARSPSPATALPLVRFTALQGIDMRSAARVHWVPWARYALVVSDGAGGFYRSPSTARLRLRFHPLVSFAPLQSPPSRVRRRCLHRQLLPWGCGPSSRHHRAASVPRGSQPSLPFRPRRFSRPRRLSPPPGLWVYFTPQPRPGFALQGFSLASSRSVFRRRSHALSPVVRRSADDVATAATNRRPALRALLRL
jgi:hypothetical protein